MPLHPAPHSGLADEKRRAARRAAKEARRAVVEKIQSRMLPSEPFSPLPWPHPWLNPGYEFPSASKEEWGPYLKL